MQEVGIEIMVEDNKTDLLRDKGPVMTQTLYNCHLIVTKKVCTLPKEGRQL